MADLGSFRELANVKVGDVERPKPLPNGHYQAIITGMWKERKAKSGNLGMDFPIQLVSPMPDVDEEQLAGAGGLEKERKASLTFWMSPDARYRFTDFGKAMGHSDDLNLLDLAEALANSREPFMIEVKSEADPQDAEKVYTRYDNPAPISAFKG